VVARIGGDEFALLLPSSGPGDTLRTVGRIADAVARQTVDGHPLSASIGHAVCPPARDLVSALKKADAAMYAAKRERSQRPAAGRDPR
jgi:diguanylate cyclase (GGDEF)-like protein